MVAANQKTDAGCRPDQLFGAWAIEPARFAAMVEQARAVDIQALQAAAAAGAQSDPQLYTTTKDGVAAIDLNGPLTKYRTSFQPMLGGTSTLQVREALRAAVRDPEVKGIFLRVDSPGGTVAGVNDLAMAIRAADARKPVHAHIEDLGASAAYWAASQARRVTGNASANVGSVGVFAILTDTSGSFAAKGVKVHVIASGEYKGAGTDGAPVTEEQLANVRRMVGDVADLFVESALVTGRKMPKARALELADGRMHMGENARALGLIDAVASQEEAMRELVREAMNIEELQTKLAATAAERDTLKATLEARDKGPEDPLASLTPAVRAVVEKAQTDARDSKAALAKIQDAQAIATYVEKAKALDSLPGAGTEAFGKTLQAIGAGVSAEQFAALETVLKASNEAVKKGGLFGEAGTTGAATGAGHEFEALSQAALKAGRAKNLTEAYRLVSKENPEAYKQHAERVRKGAA